MRNGGQPAGRPGGGGGEARTGLPVIKTRSRRRARLSLINRAFAPAQAVKASCALGALGGALPCWRLRACWRHHRPFSVAQHDLQGFQGPKFISSLAKMIFPVILLNPGFVGRADF